MSEYDAIIIGGGHNGLTCAGYLARGGMKTLVLERRTVIGGAAVTEEFHDGFRNSSLSYVVSLLSPTVMEDLELESHGLDLVKRSSGMMSLLPEGRHLLITRDHEETHAQISKFSQKDADAHIEFERELDEMAVVFRRLAENRPPNVGAGILEMWQFIKTGNRLRRLSMEHRQRLINLMTMSLGDYLDMWFESDAVKGYYAGDGSTGSFTHPYAAGTAYVLLHHAFGKIKGQLGAWWHARGGTGAITEAMAASARAHGAEIKTDTPVTKVLVEDGEVTGVETEDGSTYRGTKIIANCTPRILFDDLLGYEHVPEAFAKQIKNATYKSASFRINVALSELPNFTQLKGAERPEKRLKRSILIAPSVSYMEQAFHDARVRGYARRPFVSMNIPSLLDDTLAPEGQHVAGLFCQHFNPILDEGLDWDTLKDEAVDAVFQTIEEHAPNFRDSVLGYQAISPTDMEREYSLTGGDINHGAMQLNQLYSARPALGYAAYRMPVKNLYLCGAGAHPGGGVSGIPGRLCAIEALKNWK